MRKRKNLANFPNTPLMKKVGLVPFFIPNYNRIMKKMELRATKATKRKVLAKRTKRARRRKRAAPKRTKVEVTKNQKKTPTRKVYI